MTTLGERLSILRKKKGWSQYDAGSRLGVTKSKAAAESKFKWMELDQQEPTVSEAILLAEIFEVDLVWLLTGQEPVSTATMEQLIETYQPEFRTYLRVVLDVMRSDNLVARQIMASASTAIRAILGQINREDEMLSILKDLQSKITAPSPGESSPDEKAGRSTGDVDTRLKTTTG